MLPCGIETIAMNESECEPDEPREESSVCFFAWIALGCFVFSGTMIMTLGW